MHVTLDNAFAFSILILILITIMGYIIPSAYVSFTTIKEHQLEEIAQSIMDKILLSPGVPENWGDIHTVQSEEYLKAFGLQKANGSLYELDVDKILRVASVNTTTTVTLPSTVRISPDTIARLLGLSNEYGFSIRITPALNVSFEVLAMHCIKQTGHDCVYSVPSRIRITVKTPEGRPAIGANVTGLYILTTLEDNPGNPHDPNDAVANFTFFFVKDVTDWKGEAELEFGNPLEGVKNENRALRRTCTSMVVYVDYYGIRAVNSHIFKDYSDFEDFLNSTIIDNYLVLEFDDAPGIPNGARKLKHSGVYEPEVGLANPPYYIYLSGLEDITEAPPGLGESGWIINRGNFRIRVYSLSNIVDDDVVLIMLPVSVPTSGGGRRWILVNFFREPSNVICQKGTASGNIKTSVLKRMVRVGSFHYIVEVRVWRWGER
ncbi:MAG: hypothetical protein QXS51_03265 [Thermoproteota archaeon]